MVGFLSTITRYYPLQDYLNLTLSFFFFYFHRWKCSPESKISAIFQRYWDLHQSFTLFWNWLWALHTYQTSNHFQRRVRGCPFWNTDEKLHTNNQTWNTIGKRKWFVNITWCRGLWLWIFPTSWWRLNDTLSGFHWISKHLLKNILSSYWE